MTGDATLPTVLLVEDDELIVESVRYGLEQTGYQVLTALNGTTGLALARKATGHRATGCDDPSDDKGCFL